MTAIAFFDVDGTLFNGYTGYYMTRLLAKKKFIKPHHVLAAIFFRVMGPFYRGNVRKMYEVLLRDLEGRTHEEVLHVGKQCFEENIRPKMYQEGMEAVEEHRRLGHKIYILSSGPGMIVDHIAHFFKADGVKSIGPIVMGGVLQKEINEPICYQEGKLILAQQIAKKEKVDLSECYFYTDSIDDISLMIRVGKPRPVNPDKELRKRAFQSKWPVRIFRHYLS